MQEPSFSSQKIVGILGNGRFGRFVAELLQKQLGAQFRIAIFSRREVTEKMVGISYFSLAEVALADVVIPCVPISQFEEVVKQVAPLLKKDALVIDVCSVKVFPIEVMKKYLPESIEIVGTHPVFGPDSYQKNGGLKNMPIVLTQVRSRGETYQKIKKMCEAAELQVLEMTAEQHDKYAAYSQAYAFLVGKIGQRMDIHSTPIDTMWYKLLIEERNAIQNDSEQLFHDIQTKNPFAAEMRQRFKETVDKVFAEVA